MTTIVRILLKKICELIMQYNWSAHQHLVAKRSASACQCLVSGSSTQEPKKSAAYVVGLWFCLCFKCSTIPQCVQLRISNPQLKYGFCKKSLRNTFLSIGICHHFWVALLLQHNWSEFHLSEVTSYKIHTLVLNLTTNYVIFYKFHWNVKENDFLYSFNNPTLRFDIIFKPQHSRNNFLVHEK